jgi:hypothetical protein
MAPEEMAMKITGYNPDHPNFFAISAAFRCVQFQAISGDTSISGTAYSISGTAYLIQIA